MTAALESERRAGAAERAKLRADAAAQGERAMLTGMLEKNADHGVPFSLEDLRLRQASGAPARTSRTPPAPLPHPYRTLPHPPAPSHSPLAPSRTSFTLPQPPAPFRTIPHLPHVPRVPHIPAHSHLEHPSPCSTS